MSETTSELVKWIGGLPGWQRDALRRLALNGSLSEVDLEELCSILWAEHNLVDPATAFVADPLTAKHLRDAGQEGTDLRLLELHSIANAMQLKQNEKIAFAPIGLTLIYGDNGSGKSGYARIIKRAARARGAERVEANVFDPDFGALPPASAAFKIQITKNGKTTEHELAWEENDTDSGLDELAGMHVFDRKAAAIYVNNKHQVAFAPANLDLLTRLVEACTKLEKQLDAERNQVEQRVTMNCPGFLGGWLV